MSASAPSAGPWFDFKSATLPLEALLLKTGSLSKLSEALEARFGADSGVFNGEPVIVDLTHLASLDVDIDFPGLLAVLGRFKLKAVAVRGGSRRQTEAAALHGLVEAPDSSGHTVRTETVEVIKEVVRELRVEVPVEVRVEVPVMGQTMIVDRPLRSGQQVYAKGGDLVVLAAVNHGAEVIADGSIHVYAPLRGKAIAGAKGHLGARIFASTMEPELLSIAGTYRTTDTPLPDHIRGRAAQVRLEGDRLVFEALSS